MVPDLPRAPLPCIARCCLLALALVLSTAGLAQEPPANQVFRLEPKKLDGIEVGRAVVVKGEAGPAGHRFLVDGLSMMMPVGIALRPVSGNDTVAISLTKYAWDQPLREGVAEGEPLHMKLRTEGEFQITVTADEEGTPYRLLVWVGDEVTPKLQPAVVKASEFEGDSGGAGLVLWIIAGALLVAIALLAILVLRRKPS